MRKKGQFSFEFIMILGVILLVFLVFLTVINKRNINITDYKIESSAQRICNEVASTINTVYIMGPGAEKNIYVRHSLDNGANFTLHIVENLVEIRWDGKHYTTPLLTSNVIGSLTTGEHNISYTNGGINIE